MKTSRKVFWLDVSVVFVISMVMNLKLMAKEVTNFIVRPNS